MTIKPLFTEKTHQLASEGKYTFEVSRGLAKNQIKALVGRLFGVHVMKVKTLKIGGEVKKTFRGQKASLAPRKKAIVSLKEGEKIELFEESKKK